MAGLTSKENGMKGGRPKGKKTAQSLERDKVMAAYSQRVLHATDAIYNAQMTLALGMSHLFKIEKELVIGPKGVKTYRPRSPQLVTDVDEIKEYLENLVRGNATSDLADPSTTYYYITTTKPDGRTLNSMIDRVFGRPQQQLSVSGDLSIGQLLAEAERSR